MTAAGLSEKLPRWGIFRLGIVLAMLIVPGPLVESLRSETNIGEHYLVDVWQSEKGLPQNTVTGIAQTPDGYLWLSTFDGLARFDGVNFKMFKAGNTPALGSGRVRFLFTGRQGSLLISTQEGGVIRLINGRFEPLPLPESKGIRSPTFQTAEDEHGALWLSTEDGQVGRLVEGKFSIASTNWGGTGRSTAFRVAADSRGRLWAINDAGLYRLEGETLIPSLEGKPGEYVVHCPSRHGGWWISTGDRFRLWCDGQWVVTVPSPTTNLQALRCSLEDRSGNLWLGSSEQGVFRCDTNGNWQQFTRREGLGSGVVRALFEDGEGNVWAGTEGGGLCRLRLSLFTVYGTAQGLSSDRVTSVSEGPRGECWVGTDGYGLNRLEGETAHLASSEPGAAQMQVLSVLPDHQGHIWVGLRLGGVVQWQDGHFTPLNAPATANRTTRCLFEDSRGVVWIGQNNTTSLVRIQGDTVTTVALPQWVGPVDIRVMAEDSTGSLWIGTDGRGLLCWKEGRITRYTREDGLSSDFIWWLHPEGDGALWIGTYGGGLTRLKNGRAVKCTTRQGLVDDVICYLGDDGRGQFWFSSNQGVFRASKAELNDFADGRLARIQCVPYTKADGLPTLECEGGSQQAGCRTRDGRLWFLTSRGLVVVDPAHLNTQATPPPVHIEELVVDGVPIQFGAGGIPSETMQPVGKALGKGGSSPLPDNRNQVSARGASRPLQIEPGKKHFEFHYTAVNFSAPEHLRFRHKLEGVDTEWVETGGQRTASYPQLPHGAYTFRVQGCNREGVWNETGAALEFVVLPHFWQTSWFNALFLGTFGGGVGWAVMYVLRRRHERQVKLLQQLHALERERTRIARDIHDDLGGSLTEIGYLGALAVRDSQSLEDARKQLGRIMERIREVARRLDETVWAVNPKNDSPGHLATYLCHFAREFLEPTALRCRLDVSSSLPEVTLTAEVRHNIFLVVKEAINNAVKHSEAEELWLRLRMSDGEMIIEVSDTGRGFRVDASRQAGNGLRNMAARMEEVGGQLMVRSAPGEGATVCLRLPLPARESGRNSSRQQPIRLMDADGGRNA